MREPLHIGSGMKGFFLAGTGEIEYTKKKKMRLWERGED